MSVVVFGTCLIAATYGLVRLAYGLFLPDIQRELDLSAAGAGYISSGSSLVYCLAAAAGFALGHRSPRALIVAAAVTACGGVWGMAAAGNVAAFGIAAVLSSAGAGFASPALVTIVHRNVDARHADRAQSVVNAGTGPGLVGAAVLAVLVASEWRIAWMVTGVVTAGVAVAVLAADRRPPVQPATRSQTSPTPSPSWWADHRNAIVAATLMGAGSAAVWTYGRSLLVDAGTTSERGTVSAWLALGVGASAVIITASLMVRLSATATWMLSCTVMTVALLLLAFTPQFRLMALLAYLMFGWGFIAATSSLIAWTSDIESANSAAGTALLFVALVFGQALGATALGFIITTASFRAAFVAASVVAAMAIATATRDRAAARQGPTG
jgi:predicted MFS family arabinose efflux permease